MPPIPPASSDGFSYPPRIRAKQDDHGTVAADARTLAGPAGGDQDKLVLSDESKQPERSGFPDPRDLIAKIRSAGSPPGGPSVFTDTIDRLPDPGALNDTVERLPHRGQLTDTIDRLPDPGVLNDTVERLPHRGQLTDTIDRLPDPGALNDTVERLPHRGQLTDTIERFPDGRR